MPAEISVTRPSDVTLRLVEQSEVLARMPEFRALTQKFANGPSDMNSILNILPTTRPFIVAAVERDGCLIGWATCYRGFFRWSVKYMLDVFVDPGNRRQGIGRQVVEAALSENESQNGDAPEVVVEPAMESFWAAFEGRFVRYRKPSPAFRAQIRKQIRSWGLAPGE
jgi:GNAT superfamily N-acetyltransferase